MSDKTFNTTSPDIQNAQANESKYHDGNVPKGSDTAALQSLVAEQESKDKKIDRVQANLPLPDQPAGGASADLESADGRTVNVGSGGVNVKLGTQSSGGLREPATADSSVRIDGQEWHKPTQP